MTGQWSLARRQQIILVSSLTGVALLLGLGGAWYIHDFAERTSDRVLRASVSAVSETVSLERGKVTLEVPPGAFGMLEDSARDNVYYVVRSGQQVITGYGDFPRSGLVPAPDETAYRYDSYMGQKVRVAIQTRYLTDSHPPVVVEVAETLDERAGMEKRMLIGLVALEISLVAIAALLIKPAISWGLAPLTQLQRTINTRKTSSDVFAALDASQAPAELHGLIDTFNSLLGRLNRVTSRVREFTGDASHQMRTPLAALRTHLHLARHAQISAADKATALAEVDASAGRLQRLLDQLLSLARSESIGGTHAAQTELNALVAETARELAPQAMRRGIEIHLDAEQVLHADIDPIILTEMLTNLIDNAIRYGRDHGVITLRVARVGEQAVIEVEDDGPGIPREQRDIVFQRFYRLSRDQDVTGSGLGLAIVQSLADIAGTRLELCDASRGEGLLVRLMMPAGKVG
jgi:two-component system sensor histidine kinase TctE